MKDRQLLYVGSYYLIYSGPGDYPWTRSVAPALLFGSSHGSLQLRWEGGDLVGPACAHRAQAFSASTSEEILVAYFDPGTSIGRTIQTMTDPNAVSPLRPEHFPPELGLLVSTFFHEQVPPATVHRLIDVLSATLVDEEPAVDRRVLRTLPYMRRGNGNIDLRHSARKAGLAPSYYRKIFRRELGVGIAEYRAWQRFHEAASLACQDAERRSSGQFNEALSFSGFYDESHSAKFFNAYFGRQSMYRSLPLFFVKCE